MPNALHSKRPSHRKRSHRTRRQLPNGSRRNGGPRRITRSAHSVIGWSARRELLRFHIWRSLARRSNVVGNETHRRRRRVRTNVISFTGAGRTKQLAVAFETCQRIGIEKHRRARCKTFRDVTARRRIYVANTFVRPKRRVIISRVEFRHGKTGLIRKTHRDTRTEQSAFRTAGSNSVFARRILKPNGKRAFQM